MNNTLSIKCGVRIALPRRSAGDAVIRKMIREIILSATLPQDRLIDYGSVMFCHDSKDNRLFNLWHSGAIIVLVSRDSARTFNLMDPDAIKMLSESISTLRKKNLIYERDAE